MRRPLAAVVSVSLIATLGALALFGSAPPQRPAQAQEPRETITLETIEKLRAVLLSAGKIEAQAVLAKLPSPAELAAERQRIAAEMMKLAINELASAPTPSASRGTFYDAVRDLLTWSARRLDARLVVAADKDHLTLVAEEVGRIRELERFYREQASRRVGESPKNLLDIQYHRLELESRLAAMQSR
jgi:hypothetical protein